MHYGKLHSCTTNYCCLLLTRKESGIFSLIDNAKELQNKTTTRNQLNLLLWQKFAVLVNNLWHWHWQWGTDLQLAARSLQLTCSSSR